MLYGGSFQSSSATHQLFDSPEQLPSFPNKSHDPLEATPAGLTLRRFRLLRFRSPLLTQSNFFLFLRVLRWFTSPGSLCMPMYSACSDWLSASRVPPFGYLGVTGCLHLARAFRSLPRPSSPSRARNSILPSTGLPVLLDQRFAIDPRLPSFAHFAV